MLWRPISPGAPPGKGPGLFYLSSLDQGPLRALQSPRPVFEVVQDLSPVGVVDGVACHPGAEDEVRAGCVRTVHDLMAVRRARRPAGRVAGMEGVNAIFLDHGSLARKHVKELVFVFVP